MNRKLLEFTGYCLVLGLSAILIVGIPACSSTTKNTASTASRLSSIAISPESPNNLPIGSTQQFTAIGTYSDGSTADITDSVKWEIDPDNVATISSSGLLTGVASGNIEINAVLSGVTSPAIDLAVVLPTPTLSSITLTPKTPANLPIGSSQQFTAIGTYSDGSTAEISSVVTWASSDTTVATISSFGITTGMAAGSTDITATLNGATSAPISLTVVADTTSTTSP